MDFSLPIKIDKKLILSKFTEEQIMEYYLRIPVKKGLFKSPLRVDNHVTCTFFRNKSGTLLFKDFATGQVLNAFEVVQTIFKCNYFNALQIIANDFGIAKNKNLRKTPGKINENPTKIEEKETAKIQVELQDFSETELKWWKKYGITKEILDKYKIFSCKHVFINGTLSASSQKYCPIFGYYGGIKKDNGEKKELWRCYFPRRKNYRFITNWPAKKIQGLEQLPESGTLLVITKSMKDVACLASLNIHAIAPNSENLFIPNTVLNILKQRFKYIIVLYDNDRPGKINMAKIRKEHPELIYTFIPKKFGSKDISDFYKDYGKKETVKLIKDFLKQIKRYLKYGKKHTD